MPRNNSHPPCPACGSSATLPFENEENSVTEQTFTEIILTIFVLLLAFVLVFFLFLLSRASSADRHIDPAGDFFILAPRKEESRRTRARPHQFVCLDCSHNFKA